ncbi:TetR/AcrR family transcriptional regulator [Streptomyces sp. NBC_00344]|uniref:TetR/AcrR family transcriptional regulator n=1 Tax=Streptomyces sp. NBC_00344 TaxID=2975720 RepID=UPI003FA7D276
MAAAENAAGKRSVGRPRRVEPEKIVATARRVIEDEGIGALSMRRVAREIGVTPMALYHHVRDKDELLMLTLSGIAEGFPRPGLPEEPRARILAVAVHMHSTLDKIPWVVEILALGDLTDKAALWMVDEIIGAAMACGLSETGAVRAYRTIWHYIYGDLVFRSAQAKRNTEQPDRRRHFPELLTDDDAVALPHLTAVAGRWIEMTESYDITEQLDAVIEGLLTRRA